jgi:iron complex outermembrane receptor protein
VSAYTNRWQFLATSILALPVLAGSALAAKFDSGIPEIVVTAQRKSQDLLSVPLSIEALTGQQLKETGIKGISDLQYSTPGFVVTNSSGYQQVFVRGVGNSIYVGADPSVATYIDDIPRVYGSMVDNFIDVERVELLKGAQGGLYGRNATGGVINIITRQPSTDRFQGTARVSYGEKNTFKIAGYINIPLSDTVAFSVSAERDTHDAYVRNIATPNPYSAANFPNGSYLGTPQQTADYFNSGIRPENNLNNQNFWSVSGKLLVKPNDNLKITVAADYSMKHDTNGLAYTQIAPAFPEGTHQALLGAFGINFVPTPGFYKSSNGKFTAAVSDHIKQNNPDYGASVTAVWSLPGFDITAISAGRAQRPMQYDELTDLNVNVIGTLNLHHRWFYYEELRAVSTDEGPFHWLGGATYLYDHFFESIPNYLLPPLPTGVSPAVEVYTIVRNWTVYAQAGYDISQAVNLTVSGRFIHETNRTDFTTPIVSGTSSVQKKFVPSATLSYKFEDGGNAYARWARGWKSGGINPVAPPVLFPGGIGSVFGPETVDTYEVGYRAPMFDRTVQVTSAIFYNDYKGLQVSATAQPTHPEIIYAIVNAGAARTYGAELGVNWRISNPITIGVDGAYLNAKYKRFAIPNGPILAPFDHSGTQMNTAPKFQLALTAQLDQPLTDQYRLVGNALVSHISRVVFAQSPSPALLADAAQSGYWMTNLRLGVKTTDDKYSFAVYVNNLFNTQYYSYGGTNLGTGIVLENGDPRIFGAEIAVNF